MLKKHYRDVFNNQNKHWWYKGMTAINISLLENYLSSKKNLKILDAGCGPGVMLKPLSSYGDVVGLDLSDDALKYARKFGKVKKGDITNLKFSDTSFDVIVCMDVLYHMWVKNVNLALKEFRRVLKKGGYFVLREPSYDWMRGNEDRGSLTVRRFSRKTLKKTLEKNGFKIEKISYVNFFLFPVVFAVRIFGMVTNKSGTSDMNVPPAFVNNLFSSLLRTESNLLKYIEFPFGSSLVCVAKKNGR